MASLRQRPAEALLEQSAALLDGLRTLDASAAARPEVTALAERVLARQRSLVATLGTPAAERALPLSRLLADLAVPSGPGPGSLAAPTGIFDELAATTDRVAALLGPSGSSAPTTTAVVRSPAGPATVEDVVAVQIVALVLAADDLNRLLPDTLTGRVGARRAGAVQPHPDRSPGRRPPGTLGRGPGAPVRGRAVRHRRPGSPAHPRHPAERGRDRRPDLPPAGGRPAGLGRRRPRWNGGGLRPAG